MTEFRRLPVGKSIDSFAYFPDGRHLAVVSSQLFGRTLSVFTTDTAEVVWQKRRAPGTVVVAPRTPDAQLLVIGDGHRAEILDAASGRTLGGSAMRSKMATGIAFSADGKRLAATCSGRGEGENRGDRALVVSAVSSGHRELEIRLKRPPGAAVRFSPDGSRIVTCEERGKVAQIWDSETGELQLTIHHGRPVNALAFSPDGQSLITTSTQGTARIWNATSGVQRLRLQDDLGIACVAFSPDGQALLTTGCIGGIARIWDATTGELRLQLQHEAMVSGVAFSPDGRLLATSGGKTITLWLIR